MANLHRFKDDISMSEIKEHYYLFTLKKKYEKTDYKKGVRFRKVLVTPVYKWQCPVKSCGTICHEYEKQEVYKCPFCETLVQSIYEK